MRKFELTSETKVAFGRTLYRIRALISFGNVEAGELGGWIEQEENLNQYGDAWVSGDAWVFGDARVSGNAQVSGIGAIFWVSAVGSRNDTVTFFACKDKKIRVVTGCFFGDLEEFAAKVQATHGDNTHAKVYRLAIEMAKERIQIPDALTEDNNDED